MISHKELSRLAQLRSEEGILSVYLRLDPRFRRDPNYPLTAFKGTLSRTTRRVTDPHWLAALDREKGAVLQFLEKSQLTGRGLAIFSCQPENIWEVFSLEVMVPHVVDIDATPQTALLTQVLDEYPRFVVAVVQRDKAQIYVSEQRAAEETADITSDVPGQHSKGGWSQARFARHIELKVKQHLKQVVEELQQLYYDRPFNRLAIGGAEETVNELIKALPDPLAKRMIGTFLVDFKHETEEQILDRARQVRAEDERRSEQELIEQIQNGAKSGGQGALGFANTLAAVQEEKVRILAIAEGLAQEGSACPRCDYFAVQDFARCPLCGEEAEKTDVVERAIEKAYLTGAHIETVFGEAKEQLLAEGGIGAVLRY